MEQCSNGTVEQWKIPTLAFSEEDCYTHATPQLYGTNQ